MRKQYSFVLTEQQIQEGKGLRKLALGLGLLGSSIGISRTPLPQAVKDVHPEYGNTWGSGIAYEVMHPPKRKPVNCTENIMKGAKMGMGAVIPQEVQQANELGTNLIKVVRDKDHSGSSSFTNGFIVGRHTGD